jgi:hypothetical protein
MRFPTLGSISDMAPLEESELRALVEDFAASGASHVPVSVSVMLGLEEAMSVLVAEACMHCSARTLPPSGARYADAAPGRRAISGNPMLRELRVHNVQELQNATFTDVHCLMAMRGPTSKFLLTIDQTGPAQAVLP